MVGLDQLRQLPPGGWAALLAGDDGAQALPWLQAAAL